MSVEETLLRLDTIFKKILTNIERRHNKVVVLVERKSWGCNEKECSIEDTSYISNYGGCDLAFDTENCFIHIFCWFTCFLEGMKSNNRRFWFARHFTVDISVFFSVVWQLFSLRCKRSEDAGWRGALFFKDIDVV